MAARSEVGRDGPIGGEKALRVVWGLESPHAPLSLTGRLVGILGAIVEIPVLSMFYPRQNLAFRRAIAFELIGDDDPRDVC